MGDVTGISWADSTYNPWIGCTKVGPGCDHCYAVDVAKRLEVEWGAGAARKRTAEHTRNALARYQKGAAKFFAEHGHRRRVFSSSLADVFDNEVDPAWRAEAFAAMEAAPDVLIMICTKRVSNIEKMVPLHWRSRDLDVQSCWPRNVGILITTVTPEEVYRDAPRLRSLKVRFSIPWIGLSIEPMIANVSEALANVLSRHPDQGALDWAIFGGESGPGARDCSIMWIADGARVCHDFGVATFVKQLGARPIWHDGSRLKLSNSHGKDPAEWPDVIPRLFEFPPALDGRL